MMPAHLNEKKTSLRSTIAGILIWWVTVYFWLPDNKASSGYFMMLVELSLIHTDWRRKRMIDKNQFKKKKGETILWESTENYL